VRDDVDKGTTRQGLAAASDYEAPCVRVGTAGLSSSAAWFTGSLARYMFGISDYVVPKGAKGWSSVAGGAGEWSPGSLDLS